MPISNIVSADQMAQEIVEAMRGLARSVRLTENDTCTLAFNEHTWVLPYNVWRDFVNGNLMFCGACERFVPNNDDYLCEGCRATL